MIIKYVKTYIKAYNYLKEYNEYNEEIIYKYWINKYAFKNIDNLIIDEDYILLNKIKNTKRAIEVIYE